MTRLRTDDIKHILQELKAYDQQLLDKTGNTLKGIALHALGLHDDEFEEIVKSCKVCVIPLTSGQGVIKYFSATVSGIISHLGFQSFVAKKSEFRLQMEFHSLLNIDSAPQSFSIFALTILNYMVFRGPTLDPITSSSFFLIRFRSLLSIVDRRRIGSPHFSNTESFSASRSA